MAQADPDFQLKCQIINDVRQRPIVYNKGHPKYCIQSLKNEEFTHIGVTVGKTGKYHMDFIHLIAFTLIAFIFDRQ